MSTQLAAGAVEVRVRSHPTPFKGRHNAIVGFIPDDRFDTHKLTVEQIAELQRNKDLIVELGSAPSNGDATKAALVEAGEALTKERSEHAQTKIALEHARAQIATNDVAVAMTAAHSEVGQMLAAERAEHVRTKAELAELKAKAKK